MPGEGDVENDARVNRSRSRNRSRSPTKSRSRSRTRSKSRHRHSRRHRRRRHRSRSSSSDRSDRGRTKTSDLIKSALNTALGPIQQQLQRMNGGNTEPTTITEELNLLKQKQELLQIETKAAALQSDGSRSQFRCLATIDMKLKHAAEAIDDLMLSRSSPDEELYKSLEAIKSHVESAAKDAKDRAELVVKADSDPKLGWKTVTKFDEVQRQGPQDAEKEKIWNSCLKQVQESQKKVRPPVSQPFRTKPGLQPGYGAGQRAVTCSRCHRVGHYANNCYASFPLGGGRFNDRYSKPSYKRPSGGYNSNFSRDDSKDSRKD